MGIIKFLFIFGLLILLVFVLMGATVVMRIVNSVRKAFRQQDSQQDAGGYARQHRYETYGDEEKVIDKRSPQEANRKIFADNEGEYVDYEESKN